VPVATDDPAPHSDPGPESPPPVIVAEDVGVDGEHGPLVAGADFSCPEGLHALQMAGAIAQKTLLLTLAGRLRPSRGTVTVLGASTPRAIRTHCAIAGFAEIDDLEESVTVRTVIDEQRRWLAPWYRRVRPNDDHTRMAEVFGDAAPPAPRTFIGDLSDLQNLLLRVGLALLSDRAVLVVGDLEQVRDDEDRAVAATRLAAVAAGRTVVVGVTNPLGPDAPEHRLHRPCAPRGED
jgi:hypothetical protein